MRLVITCGVFDLLHAGHFNLFSEMRKRGDITLAILHDGFTTFRNKRKFPIENLEKRTRNVIECGLIDMVAYTFEESPDKAFTEIIERYRHKFELVFVRADDWLDFPGKKTIDSLGVKIEYIPYTKGTSSTSLRDML